MQFLRLNSIALAVVFTQAAVLPRQEGISSSLTSLPNTSATSKAYLTSITTLPMPTSVEGNTAYPPSTTSVENPGPAQTSAFSTPYTSAFSASSSQTPLTWNANATSSNMTASQANATTSLGSAFATGLSASTGNVTVSGVNSTLASVSASSTGFASSTNTSTRLASATNDVRNATGPATVTQSTFSAATAPTTANQDALTSSAPYANSTTNGLVGGVAATGTAVIVTGVSAANATQSASLDNSTRPVVLLESTSSIIQRYLNLPSSLRAAKATRSPKPSSTRGPVALFGANTTAPGVAQATGINVPSTVLSSNTTMATVTVKPTAAASSNTTSSSTMPLSTGSSSNKTTAPDLVANAVDNNGTMFAITWDAKNGTIIELLPANSTNPLAATGTTSPFSTASASANLGRRQEAIPTSAPITPAAAPKGSSWNKLSYSSTESATRPSRYFSGEGWMLRRRFWA
jgi:hypothetical protein